MKPDAKNLLNALLTIPPPPFRHTTLPWHPAPFGSRLFVINFVAVKCNCICSHASKRLQSKKKKREKMEKRRMPARLANIFLQWSSPDFSHLFQPTIHSAITLFGVISIFDGVFRLNCFWCEYSPAL